MHKMDRGDVYEVVLDPVVGRETKGRRRVLVLTPHSFNKTGTAVVVPIMTVGNLERDKGFAINLSGNGGSTSGVAVCSQPRSLDLKSRNAKFIESMPENIVNEVIEKVLALLD